MNDEDVIAELRARARQLPPVALVLYLSEATGVEATSSGNFIAYFKRAFPAIPLHTLYEACLVGPAGPVGGPNDEKLNELLRPWLPSGV